MWVLAILLGKYNKIEIRTKLQNVFTQNNLVSIKVWAEIMWGLANLLVKNIIIKIENKLGINLKSASFSLKIWPKMKHVLAILRVKNNKSEIKLPGVCTRVRLYFLQYFELKECGLCYFACWLYLSQN